MSFAPLSWTTVPHRGPAVCALWLTERRLCVCCSCPSPPMSHPFSTASPSSVTDSDDMFAATHEDDNIFGGPDDRAPQSRAATTADGLAANGAAMGSTQRHARAASRFTLEPIDAPAPSASPASFAARRKRQSLFDEDETEEVLSLVKKTETPAAAATSVEASTAASTAAHTSAAAPSIALAAFSEAIPVDEDLAQMLASFSPSLQLELAGSSGASPSVSTQAPDSSKPFFASASSSRRVDELEFDRWGSSTKSPGGSGGALFSDLFGERGATPSASPSNSDGKVAHRKLTDSLYQVWPKEETGGSGKARTLKLTESELQALNLDGSVSKSFPYSDIFCVTCQETTRLLGPPVSADDPSIAADGVVRSVSISFISDADLSYISPQAVQLSADLNERLSMRTSAEEAANGTTAGHADRLFDGQAYHEKLLAQQQDPAAATAIDPTAVFFTPTNASSSSSSQSSSGSGGRGSVSAATSPAAAAATASTAKSETPKGSFAERAQKNGARSSTDDAASAPSPAASADPAFLAWQARYALDQKLQALIDRIWLDASSEEGKARSKFLKTSFPSLESKPPTQLLASTRKFLDSFRSYMEKKRWAQLREAIVGPKDGEGLLSAKEFEETFHARVERSAEVAVLMPILPRLSAAVAPLTREADQQILAQMTLLRGKSQHYLGIPPQHHSPSGWSAAIRELMQVERFHLPADKLEVILGMVKCVYSTYKRERENREIAVAAGVAAAAVEQAAAATPTPAAVASTSASASTPTAAAVASPASKSSSSSMFLPADDLFPILIYIVSQSGLKSAATLKASLWGLCDPQQLQAEGQTNERQLQSRQGAKLRLLRVDSHVFSLSVPFSLSTVRRLLSHRVRRSDRVHSHGGRFEADGQFGACEEKAMSRDAADRL